MQPSLPDHLNSVPFNCSPCFISYSMSLCSLLCQINSIQFHLTAIPASSHTVCLYAAFFARSLKCSLPFNCSPCFISYSMSLCSLLCRSIQFNSICFNMLSLLHHLRYSMFRFIPAAHTACLYAAFFADQFNSIPFNCYPCFISYSMSLCSLLCQINSIQFHLTAIPASSHTVCLYADSLQINLNSIPFNCYPCFISYSICSRDSRSIKFNSI